MQNQQNNELKGLRKEIDEIDDQIIALFNKRMDVVQRVGELKQKNNDKFFIKSAREADMIKELIKKAGDNFPKSTIITIWRKMITNANMAEQPLKIAIHNPQNLPDYSYLVKSYYNDEVPLTNFDSATNLIAEMQKGKANIGVFALPKSEEDKIKENWWINLANNNELKVYAKIPLVEYKGQNNLNLVAVAAKDVEKSSEDNSLLSIELKSDVPKHKLEDLLKKHQISGKILQSAIQPQINDVKFYLFEVDGFYEESDEVIQAITKDAMKPYIKVIGHYAKVIEL